MVAHAVMEWWWACTAVEQEYWHYWKVSIKPGVPDTYLEKIVVLGSSTNATQCLRVLKWRVVLIIVARTVTPTGSHTRVVKPLPSFSKCRPMCTWKAVSHFQDHKLLPYRQPTSGYYKPTPPDNNSICWLRWWYPLCQQQVVTLSHLPCLSVQVHY